MLKTLVRSMAHWAGYDVISLDRSHADRRCIKELVATQQINLILDIGANYGQFAKWCREIGYRSRIISFEPLTDAHNGLVKAASRDRFWIVAPRMALGSDHA